MNVTQVTGEGPHSQLWIYFVIAVALMTATFGGWFVWSQLMSSMGEQGPLRTFSRRAAKLGCV